MDIVLTLLAIVVAWRLLCLQYQRGHIALLGRHLARLQIERHMETLTQGYTRAIHEKDTSRQLQILDGFSQTERTVAAQLRTLAEAMRTEDEQATRMGILPFCVPYLERFLPTSTRDFRALLDIHAQGLRRVVDNADRWGPKERAYHLSAELYLMQHSCHWYCKSRSVADVRLSVRHQVTRQKVLDSVSDETRQAYLRWLRSGAGG
ncbi:hypothetical protein [Castellaniella caeni]|uniref:hypothetical protein n=1 Tax=Castellaniella caeni TaxID=266123 RepID=UPI00082A40B2|nr:hypothetical protein [Castellaniella caeni]